MNKNECAYLGYINVLSVNYYVLLYQLHYATIYMLYSMTIIPSTIYVLNFMEAYFKCRLCTRPSDRKTQDFKRINKAMRFQ